MTNASTPPSPLATPLAWNLVAGGYAEESFAQFAKYATDALALAEVKSGERILDVAAGPGSLSIQAAAIASEVHAVDFAVKMIGQLASRVRQQGLTNVQVREADGQALPFEDGRFDAAFSMFGLIFFPERGRGFSELFRVVRPGGRAVVSSWQPMSRVPLLVSVFEALAAELPNLPFGDGKGPLSDREALRREMSEVGFEVEVVERVHAIDAPDIDAFWKSMRRALAPLVLLEHRMGAEAFASVAAGIERRLRAQYEGPIRVEMPAWLALGKKP